MNTEITPPTNSGPEQVRRVARWIAILGATAWALFAGGFLASHSFTEDGFIITLAEKQFGAMMMVPMAALMALCVVVILEWTGGHQIPRPLV